MKIRVFPLVTVILFHVAVYAQGLPTDSTSVAAIAPSASSTVPSASVPAEGMYFEHLPSWKAVLAKAKAADKLVFLDCYTTWCGPCKVMSSKIFTQPAVGDFYNTHFINAKVQLDSTDDDDDYVKSWYQDGHDIALQYEVRAYPTYLIFNGDGEIIHRFVGSMDATSFITAGKKILDPEQQYHTQVRRYEQGDRSPAFLLKLSKLAQDAYDKKAKIYTSAYLETQTDLYTKENLELLYSSAQSSKDKGFQIALNEAVRADQILGQPQRSTKLAKSIIVNEALGGLFRNLKKGETPDFAAFDTQLKTEYPEYADFVSAYAKMYYHRSRKQWADFAVYVDQLVQMDGSSARELNSYAWMVFEQTADQPILKKALGWSQLSLTKDSDNPAYADTYANLLYKLGSKEEAIQAAEKALTLAEKSESDASAAYKETLEKMKTGAPTWPEQ